MVTKVSSPSTNGEFSELRVMPLKNISISTFDVPSICFEDVARLPAKVKMPTKTHTNSIPIMIKSNDLNFFKNSIFSPLHQIFHL